MRQITDIHRTKKTFNITVKELKEGKWLKEIPDSDMVELLFKSNYLTISDCNLRKTPEKGNQEGEKHDGRQDNKTSTV